jgi:hypothetical protein
MAPFEARDFRLADRPADPVGERFLAWVRPRSWRRSRIKVPREWGMGYSENCRQLSRLDRCLLLKWTGRHHPQA